MPRNTDRRRARHEDIMVAAYEILAERGYEKATMAAVAGRARASKETLYNWYGDKRSLFAALVSENASGLCAALDSTLDPTADRDIRGILHAFGRTFLDLLLGERAVALNRAAIANASNDGSLGELLAAKGRDTVFPQLCRMLEVERAAGRLGFADAEDAGETLLGLLLTDRQTRRLLGTLSPPGQAWIENRAKTATDRFMQLFGTK